MNRIFAIIVIIISAYACAGQPPTDFELAETTCSPQRTFEVEHYVYSRTNMPSNYYWQHWISYGEKAQRKHLLYESDGSVETMISPDDAWIVINDRLGSTDRVALLFSRGRGLMFGLVTNLDLRAEAFHAAAIEQGYASSQVFEHSYCEALCWLGPHALILHAWGHADSEPALLKDWYCIYDIKSRLTSFDLTTINKGAFQGDPRQRMAEKGKPGCQPSDPRNHRTSSAPVVRGR